MTMSASRMHCLKVSARAIFLLVITVVAASAAFAQAQADAADLRGYVRDQQAAVITNATVTARSPATNKTYTTTTNSDGFYQLLNLTPGDYDLTVEAPSFKKASLPPIKLTVGQRGDLDVALEPGSIDAEVTISGATIELKETSKTAIA